MFNDLSSLRSYLETRRSGRPRDMVAPGPDSAQIREIVASACRTPDHGKLAPWRVVAIRDNQRDALAEALVAAYRAETPGAGRLEFEAMENIAHQAPALLVVLFAPVESTKIPLWEQQLSCGAFIMNLLNAAHARDFVGGWITGWPAFNNDVRDLFGSAPERIAGFVYLGSPGGEMQERPRPDVDAVLSHWEGVRGD